MEMNLGCFPPNEKPDKRKEMQSSRVAKLVKAFEDKVIIKISPG